MGQEHLRLNQKVLAIPVDSQHVRLSHGIRWCCRAQGVTALSNSDALGQSDHGHPGLARPRN